MKNLDKQIIELKERIDKLAIVCQKVNTNSYQVKEGLENEITSLQDLLEDIKRSYNRLSPTPPINGTSHIYDDHK